MPTSKELDEWQKVLIYVAAGIHHFRPSKTDEECEREAADLIAAYRASLSASPEPTYPCDQCGAKRTKAEGGTTFTVCDECWNKQYRPASLPDVEAEKAAIRMMDEILCVGCAQQLPINNFGRHTPTANPGDEYWCPNLNNGALVRLIRPVLTASLSARLAAMELDLKAERENGIAWSVRVKELERLLSTERERADELCRLNDEKHHQLAALRTLQYDRTRDVHPLR